MIPVALPSLSFVLTVVFLLGTTLVWLVWTLSLPFQGAGHRLPRPVHKILYGLMACLSLWTLYQLLDFKWQMDAYRAQMQTQFAPTLQEASRLGGLDLPAQTQLRLAIANTPESFRTAHWSEPIDMAGIAALQVERAITIQTNAEHQTTGFQAESIRVTGLGETLQDGWRCDALQPVEFNVEADGRIAQFQGCVLADDNHAAGIALPKGTALRRSQGNTYTDGFVDTDRWSLDVPADHIVDIAGLALRGPLIRLDEQRQLHEVSRAELAHEAVVEQQAFKAGDSMHYNPRSQRTKQPLQWFAVP